MLWIDRRNAADLLELPCVFSRLLPNGSPVSERDLQRVYRRQRMMDFVKAFGTSDMSAFIRDVYPRPRSVNEKVKYLG